MALTVVTLSPNSTSQTGAATNTVVGAANAHSALSDASDSSYVQMTARARNEAELVRVGFPAPTIPAGGKILSVELNRKILTFASGQVMTLNWLRTLEGDVLVDGQQQKPYRLFFQVPAPTDGTGGTYVNEGLGKFTTTDSGAAWDASTNMSASHFFVELGRGDDLGGNLRISELSVKVTYQRLATVTVTGPTGTSTKTRPTITWTYSSPDSQPQQSYRVMVYTAAQVAAVGFVPFSSTPLVDSGELLGEDLSWTVTDDLPDGGYSAYVQATSKWAGPGDFPTAVASTSWTRDVTSLGTQPPNATLSSVTFDLTNDRNAITMVPSSSSPTTAAFTVLVSRDGGVTFDRPPSLQFIPANGTTPVTVYDYLAPIAATSHYKVLAYSQPSGTYVAASGTSSALSVLTSGDTWRLADPQNPLNNCIVTPVSGGAEGKHDEVTFPRVSASFQPIGGAGTERPPIVVNGPVAGEAGVLTLLFAEDQRDNWPLFRQQMQSGHTLLLKKSFAQQLWVRLAAGPNTQDPKLTYVAVPGRPDRIMMYKVVLPYTQTVEPTYF